MITAKHGSTVLTIRYVSTAHGTPQYLLKSMVPVRAFMKARVRFFDTLFDCAY